MTYWLVKSEPETWSWSDHLNKGIAGWDGVRNHQAAKFLKAMALGDQVFFYHSGKERAIVGICEVVKLAYPDPSDDSGRFVMVDLKAVTAMPQPITLGAIKTEESLSHLALIKQSRLSVMPIDAAAWTKICAMGGM